MACLVHAADKAVNVRLAVTSITTLNEVLELAGPETASGVRQLEGPQELAGCLEVGAGSRDLVHEVLNRDNAVLAELLLNDGVVGDGDALPVNLGETALVDQFTDGLQVGLTPGHVGSNKLEHLLSGVGHLDEDTIVDLQETEQLHDLARLGRDVANTTDTNNKGHAGLSRHKEVALRLRQAAQTNLLALGSLVLLYVLLSALEDDLALLLAKLKC